MKFFFLLIFPFLPALTGFSQNQHLKLWYTTPAGKDWDAALPIGNGRLAAMVFGNPANEIISS
ncbi:MAG: glycoside hydrolase family 95 protein [Bacteroidota bacterium]|nr:glycoside hydrolase family 95 protein [Bacteroidota bacterium]